MEFVLYEDEKMEYRFKEQRADGSVSVSDFKEYRIQKEVPAYGTYGRLNDMSELTKEALDQAMAEYMREEKLAREFFMLY